MNYLEYSHPNRVMLNFPPLVSKLTEKGEIVTNAKKKERKKCKISYQNRSIEIEEKIWKHNLEMMFLRKI